MKKREKGERKEKRIALAERTVYVFNQLIKQKNGNIPYYEVNRILDEYNYNEHYSDKSQQIL